jgi:hypothetical protein
MIRAHQPGSQPIDIPEVIPNPAVVPKHEPAPKEPAPKNPVKVPEKVLAGYAPKDSDNRCPRNVTSGREPAGLIPIPSDQNLCAQSRSPMDMILQG